MATPAKEWLQQDPAEPDACGVQPVAVEGKGIVKCRYETQRIWPSWWEKVRLVGYSETVVRCCCPLASSHASTGMLHTQSFP